MIEQNALMNKLLEKAIDLAGGIYFNSHYDGFCTAMIEFSTISDDNWEKRIDSTFKSLLKDSSLRERFKWKINKTIFPTHYIITTTLQIYPRLGEKVDELMTVLKMEGII